MDIRLIFRSYLDSFDDAGTQTVNRDAQWFQFATNGEPDREVRRFDCQEKPLRRGSTHRKAGNGKKDRSPPDGDEAGFGPSRTTGRGAGRDDLPAARRGSIDLRIGRAKRDATVVIPRRAAEHRTVLEGGFGSHARPGWTERQRAACGSAPDREARLLPREGAVRWEATPELVSQDREADEGRGKLR
jgi:hypothetical protein